MAKLMSEYQALQEAGNGKADRLFNVFKIDEYDNQYGAAPLPKLSGGLLKRTFSHQFLATNFPFSFDYYNCLFQPFLNFSQKIVYYP